ncbi:MAG: hypothetical protein EOP83_16585 [Verrucomicrobiaceae bacterium]|nr:MAG: hypothetical protein EOP83_16585 [Verrucomicrobiaceae bacterium]
MKTLDQIEARIPLNATTAPGNANGVHVIATPGSYYLTGDVQGVASKDAIIIEASNVTLDLNGYSLKGVASSLNGIAISRSNAALTGITIRNGFITGFGQRGVHTVGTGAVQGLTIEDLTVACVGTGVRSDVSGSTVVRRVFVRGGVGGIQCAGANSVDQIEDCVVSGTTGEAIIGDVVEGCQVSQVTNSGLVVLSGSRISHCRVASVSGATGLVGIYGEEVNDCVVSDLTLTAAGPVDGVAGDLVSATRVQNLISAGGNVRGIAQRNSSQGVVNGCSVASLKTTGTATVTGIQADSVSQSQISRLGYEGATGAVNGIIFGSRVDDCSVRGLGHVGTTSIVIGIDADTTGMGAVSRAVVQDFKGAGGLLGISASMVKDSKISKFTQNGSNGFPGNQAINATTITGCTISELTANASLPLFVVSGETVTDTTVNSVSNSFSGSFAHGISGRHIVNCAVTDIGGIGLSGKSTASLICDCTVSNASVGGIEYSGQGGLVEGNSVRGCPTGIQTTASSNRAVVRGNTVTTCPTRYNMNANSVVGPIVTATGTIASTNPFANFSD